MVILFSLAVVLMFLQYSEGLFAGQELQYHTVDERAFFHRLSRDLPHQMNELFAGSGSCVECHGSDPDGIASIIGKGTDINVLDDWRATMMANSARDPFWRAKVSHEVLVNPQLTEEIETTCTSCHAPMGHFEAMYLGEDHYGIEQMVNDSLAMDGVSCLSCHQMAEEGLGDFFSGQLFFDTSRVAYGPYISPLASPMIDGAGYTPVYSPHINDAGLCAGCHTLITQTVDLNGEVTDNNFVEQATYHEWLNSVYNDDVSCQSCHVPRVEGPVQIVAGYDTEARSPFGLHYFVGGNTYMVEMIRDNRVELGSDATVAQFDSVLARTTRLLQQQTLELDFSLTSRDADTAFFELGLQNLAGHKFPSGYPARLAFMQFILTNNIGDTLFASGLLDEDYRIIGRDQPYEVHYNIIREPDEVQVYEMVMADIAGEVTTVLESAYSTIKDNRLPPIGFTDEHFAYDTTKIEGLALIDPDFNRVGEAQGTGIDLLRYHIPLNGYSGELNAKASVYYQPVPPRWLDEMFEYSSPEIDYFAGLYNGQSPEPVIIAEETVFDNSTSINVNEPSGKLRFYAWNGQWYYHSTSEPVRHIRVFTISGQLVKEWQPNRKEGILTPTLNRGIYIVQLETENKRHSAKVIH